MASPVLQLSRATIYQRKNLILSEVNVTIEPGYFVYLIRKTGSGKSSFMKTLYRDLPLTYYSLLSKEFWPVSANSHTTVGE